MKASITLPHRLIHLTGMFSRHFGLAHLALSNESYLQTLKEFAVRGEYVTLDNGVTETGTALHLPTLLMIAKTMGANEIVLPDVFDNGPATMELLEQSCAHLDSLPGAYPTPACMAVLHGKTIDEVTRNAHAIVNLYPHVRTLGIPKVLTRNILPEVEEGLSGRLLVLEALRGMGTIFGRFEIHLLGVWNNVFELSEIRKRFGERIRSVDTSMPVMAGLNNVCIMSDPKFKLSLADEWNFRDIHNMVIPYQVVRNLRAYRTIVEG